MSGQSMVVVAVLLQFTVGCTGPSDTVSGPTGRIEVGGRDMWIECLGQGSPVVVIESNSAVGTASGTLALGRGVAEHTTVCRYDRAGKGKSDPAPRPHSTMAELVDDLATLLVAADLPGPYLLVGGSLGAQIVLNYTLTHEDEVAGLIILDTDLPSTDVSRDPLGGLLDPEEQADYFRGTDRARAWLAETESLLRPLPAVAIRVLTATQPDDDCPAYWGEALCKEALARHIAFQADWLVLNPNATLVEIDAPPDLAGAEEAVVREINAALEDLRAGQ